jgi:hypothetical protein
LLQEESIKGSATNKSLIVFILILKIVIPTNKQIKL